MTPQEFLSQLEASPFSENTKAQIRTILGSATELTPELREGIKAIFQAEIEDDLKDVALDPIESTQLEAQLDMDLKAIEDEAAEDEAAVEREVQELSEMSRKVDVLERLHS